MKSHNNDFQIEQQPVTTFTYDPFDKLSGVSAANLTAGYQTGPDGTRFKKTVNGQITDFTYGRVTLGLTAAQESTFESCMKGDHGSYSAFSNNCGDPVEKCLQSAGMNIAGTIFPGSLGVSLLKSGMVIYGNHYPALPSPRP